MSELEIVHLEHVPPTHRIAVAFYRNVTNAAFLQSQLLARNSKFEYAFIDAAVVVSRLQLLAAVFKGVVNLLEGALKTPNVHSEMVTSLSPTNNIAEAYRRFGISADTKHMIAVKVLVSTDAAATSDAEEALRHVTQHLAENVKGERVPFTDAEIAGCTDWTKVRKYYKLNGIVSLDQTKDSSAKSAESAQLIIGAMATRGVL